jgi:hypothetical protein
MRVNLRSARKTIVAIERPERRIHAVGIDATSATILCLMTTSFAVEQ